MAVRETWVCLLGVALAGCGGGGEPATPPDGKPAAPDAEVQARVEQWCKVLAEAPPEGFPGDPSAVAWWKRREAAANELAGAGAVAVPALVARASERAAVAVPGASAGLMADLERRAQGHAQRLARGWAIEILGEIRAPESAAGLRKVLGTVSGDWELELGVIEALGRVGDASDVARLAGYVGSEPKNTVIIGGVDKMRAEITAVLQNAAIEAQARLGNTGGMALMIQNMHGGGWARADAAVRVRALTGQGFGFALDAPTPDRQATVERALEWWKGAAATWKPVPATRAAHAIFVRPEKP